MAHPRPFPRPRPVHVAGALVREAEATARTALYPFNRYFRLPDPTPAPGRAPVVMIHGLLGHPGMLQPLARYLLDHGWPRVERVGYPSIGLDFQAIVDRLDAVVQRVGEPVDLVGHSLGATVCRAYLKLHGGQARRFVALAPPFGGTSLFRLVPGALREPLHPRGDLVQRLAEGPEPVPTTIVRARYDAQILPAHRSRLVDDPEVEEIDLDGIGHNGLLCSRRAHAAVAEALSRGR